MQTNQINEKFISTFEQEQEDYIFELEPQSNNLFLVANFYEHGNNRSDVYGEKQLRNSQYRARSVELPNMTFDFETDQLTKLPIFKSGKFNYEVKISWLEDVYHTMYRYHKEWMERWYDYKYNVLKCGVDGKFRSCELIAYHYVKDGDVFNPVVKPKKIYTIKLYGLVPRDLPPLRHSYDDDGGASDFTVSYMCSNFEIVFENKDEFPKWVENTELKGVSLETFSAEGTNK